MTLQQQNISTLLLNSGFIENTGLLNGKMGIAICFYHLAREYNNRIYENFAGDLIDEIYQEITVETPVDFENGLAGIGWGIEYLVQNGFIEANTDEVLEEFDYRISEELIHNNQIGIGLQDGILGIGAYFLNRLRNQIPGDTKIPVLTSQQAIPRLIDKLDSLTGDISKILPEPQTSNNKQQTLNSYRVEPQATNLLNHKPQTTNNQLFDITWDYPVLVWLLAELYRLNISNLKIKKFANRLLKPLLYNDFTPELQSSRLLLVFVLVQLKQATSNRINTDEIIAKLLGSVNRSGIKAELPFNDFNIKNGTSGIALIYLKLFESTLNAGFKHEWQYWLNQFNLLNFNQNESLRFPEKADLLNQQDLMKGIAGPLLLHCISNPIADFRITPNKEKGQEALPSERPTLSAPAPSINSENYR